MRRDGRTPDETLDPLFEECRFVEPVSDVTRARSLLRARARLAAERSAPQLELMPSRASRLRIAMAAAAALALVATGAAAALLGHRSVPSSPPSTPATSRAVSPPAVVQRDPSPAPADELPSMSAPSPKRRARAVPSRETQADELTILRRAQAAYADGNYPAVVDLLGEHARRFSRGRLAEEADALRIRSLARCGREEEARRALDGFVGRFPHSLLLPALRRALDGRGLDGAGTAYP